tara:strand:+ start:154 stop:909 length:756 start_codon:yes stop_codon:yes gene_type:complete
MVQFGVAKWISSLPDSPASRFQSQDQTSEPKIPDTSGLTLPESSAKYDPASSSWKTSQVSLFTRERLSLATWPKWGMIHRGVLFELPMPERITAARGGSAPRSLPTPTVHHAKMGNHDEDPQDFLKRAEEYRSKTGGTIGMSLGVAARLYPTPTAKANQTAPSMLAKGGSFSNLWPTPIAREAKDQGLDLQKKRRDGKSRDDSLTRRVSIEQGLNKAGRLNPQWVEWLMGWPIGWTDCDSSETESFPSKQL